MHYPYQKTSNECHEFINSHGFIFNPKFITSIDASLENFKGNHLLFEDVVIELFRISVLRNSEEFKNVAEKHGFWDIERVVRSPHWAYFVFENVSESLADGQSFHKESLLKLSLCLNSIQVEEIIHYGKKNIGTIKAYKYMCDNIGIDDDTAIKNTIEFISINLYGNSDIISYVDKNFNGTVKVDNMIRLSNLIPTIIKRSIDKDISNIISLNSLKDVDALILATSTYPEKVAANLNEIDMDRLIHPKNRHLLEILIFSDWLDKQPSLYSEFEVFANKLAAREDLEMAVDIRLEEYAASALFSKAISNSKNNRPLAIAKGGLSRLSSALNKLQSSFDSYTLISIRNNLVRDKVFKSIVKCYLKLAERKPELIISEDEMENIKYAMVNVIKENALINKRSTKTPFSSEFNELYCKKYRAPSDGHDLTSFNRLAHLITFDMSDKELVHAAGNNKVFIASMLMEGRLDKSYAKGLPSSDKKKLIEKDFGM